MVTLSLVMQIIGAVVGGLLLCASLFVHIYICSKRPRAEIQGFLTCIFVLMHLVNGLSVALFATKVDGSAIINAIACDCWIIDHTFSYLLVNIWIVLFILLNWTFIFQYLKVATIVPIAFGSKMISSRERSQINVEVAKLKRV